MKQWFLNLYRKVGCKGPAMKNLKQFSKIEVNIKMHMVPNSRSNESKPYQICKHDENLVVRRNKEGVTEGNETKNLTY